MNNDYQEMRDKQTDLTPHRQKKYRQQNQYNIIH